MRSLMSGVMGLLLAVISCASHAGYLIQGATIVSVTNTANQSQAFAVYFTGGAGACAASGQIVFPQSAAVDADTFKRTYAAALAGAVTKARFDAFDYSGTNCANAGFIQLYP